MVAKIIAGVIGGFLVGACGFLLATLALGPVLKEFSGGIFFALWSFAFLVSLLTSSGGKAWRFNWILSSVLCVLFPISGLMFSSAESVGAQKIDPEILQLVIDRMLEFPYSGSVGIFLGILFLIFGLIAGKENTGMYMVRPDQQMAPPKNTNISEKRIPERFPEMDIRETGNDSSHWSKKHF